MRLFCELLSAGNRIGVFSEQDADEVFLLLNLLLESGNLCACRENQLLRLTHIEHGSGTAVSQEAGEPERFLARRESALRDFQLQVQRAKLEISPGDIRHQGDRNLLASRFAGKKVGARGLCCATILAPKIKLPGGGKIHVSGAAFKSGKEFGFCGT